MIINIPVVSTTCTAVAVYLFVKYRLYVKGYWKVALAIVGISFGAITINFIIKTIFATDTTGDINRYAYDFLISARNVILASVGLYLLKKSRLPSVPLYNWHVRHKELSHFSTKVVVFSVLFLTLYSVFLFRVTSARLNITSQPIPSAISLGVPQFFAFLFVNLAVVIREEIMYRLCLQTLVTYWLREYRWAWTLAVLISTLLWSMGHFGIVLPEWAKFVQVFVVGILLGVVMHKQGFESCILIHLGLNLSMMFSEEMHFF